jgi:type I secretion membrane fusion protein, HlyD family
VESVNNKKNEIDVDPKKQILFGNIFLLLGFGGFLLWAVTAPLDQGVTGKGVFRISGERKEIQSVSGGLIESIFIREGDKVSKEQVLIKLSEVQAKAQMDIIATQWLIAKATQIRLQSEQNDAEAIKWTDDLLVNSNIKIKESLKLQEQQFLTKQSEFKSAQSILKREGVGLNEQLAGLIGVNKSLLQQKELHLKKINSLSSLALDGYVAKNRVIEELKNKEELNAKIASNASDIGKIRQSISEIELKILLQKQTNRKEIESQLAEISREVNTLSEKLKSAEFDVKHTEIKAPVSGTIVDLKTHTEGGVLTPGQRVMDLVPGNSELVVEARFSSVALDKLKAGLKVNVSFPTLNRVETPIVSGVLKTVSADQLIDGHSNEPYFLTEIVLQDESLLALKNQNVVIRPGLPADVVVITGERTLFNYLIKPIKRRFNGALKED